MDIQDVYAYERLEDDASGFQYPVSCITSEYNMKELLHFINVSTDVDEKLLNYVDGRDEWTIVLYCFEKPNTSPLNRFTKSDIVLSEEYKQFVKDGGSLSPIEWNEILKRDKRRNR